MKKKSTPLIDIVRSIKTNTTLVLALAVILIVAAFIYVPAVQEELGAKPSEAGGITWGGDSSSGSTPGIGGPPDEALPAGWDFSNIIQLTGQPGFPPDGSWNFPENHEWPQSIYGDWLVFKWDPTPGDHYDQQYMLYNLKTKEIRQITDDIIFNAGDTPRIWGDYVTWCGSTDLNLYIYNIENDTTTILDTKCRPWWEYSTGIYENKIVFIEEKVLFEDYSLNIIDLSQGIDPIVIFTTNYLITNPVIYGSTIVWKDFRNSSDTIDAEIYGYDMDTGIEFPINTNLGYKTNLNISGDKIIWTDLYYNWPNESIPYIYMYSINQQQGGAINLIKSDWESTSSMSNGYIAYTGRTNGSYNLYVYEISTNKEILIKNNIATWPQVYMDKYPIIIWGDNFNLYMSRGVYPYVSIEN